MGIMPDSSQYGSQTVTGPGWPNVEEETLAEAATSYEALAAKITGSIVPQQQSQMMAIGEKWTGDGAAAAMGEATMIIGGHEINAAQATAIAAKLRAMEVTVAKTKTLVNATAEATNSACLAAMAMPNSDVLIQSLVKMGLSQNIADVNANTAELAGTVGVVPNIPNPGAPPMVGAQKAASEASKQGQDGSQQAIQMLSQLGQMAGQLPQMLMQLPQQMMQQVTQPLQQLSSMFGSGGGGAGGKGAGSAGVSPFPAFSNHPLAGGSGKGGGGGLTRAASLPGSGGVNLQTPLMAGLVGTQPADVAVHPAASSAAIGGIAPIGAGMGGMGMMGGRGEGGGGGTVASLSIPAPLDHDLGDGDVDDDW
jgi:hypothetical protein